MLFLSELYGRIGQILHEHGDMEVTRMQDKGIDGILAGMYSGFMEYDNTDFYIHQSDVTEGNGESGKVIASRKRFVINPFGNGKRSKDRY